MQTDPNSAANFNSFLTSHLHLHLKVDFSSKTLKGFVDVYLKRLLDDSQAITLDVNNVAVSAVSCGDCRIPVTLVKHSHANN